MNNPMKDQKKILFHALPAAVAEALTEQLAPRYRIMDSSDALTTAMDEPPDAVITEENATPAFLGCPVISVSLRQPIRLLSLLRDVEQALQEPTLYLDEFPIGDFMFHPQEKRLVSKKNVEIDLTDRETDMLAYLARHHRRSVGRDELLQNVWRYQKGVDTHTLETHIYRLRQKTGGVDDKNPGQLIITDKDGGYKIAPDTHVSERGNILLYILIAIFLSGVLVVTLTQGPEKSALTSQLDELSVAIKSDISTIESAVMDCVIMYPKGGPDTNGNGTISATENANNPFPMGSNIAAYAWNEINAGSFGCPGAPAPDPGLPDDFQPILNTKEGRALRVLSDTTNFSTWIINSDQNEGVVLLITKPTSDPLWLETISRLNSNYSTCKAATVVGAANYSPIGNCTNGCFLYWFKRPSTSTWGPEAGCP